MREVAWQVIERHAQVDGGVFAHERRQHIALLVEEHGRVRVTDLAVRFGVSGVTIRKDLQILEAQGRLIRAHGGAISLRANQPELAFDIRERLQAGEKALIGAHAARLVADGESIVFDASTTALSAARALKARGGWTQLTVITNGLRIATELAGYPGIRVLMLGGWLRWEALSLVGPLGAGIFNRINVQTAFLGAAGFALDSGLSDATEEEAQIKRSMVRAARKVVAIVDHTKWGRSAFATFCQADEITSVITDKMAPEDLVDDVRRAGIDVEFVDQDGLTLRSPSLPRAGLHD